MKSIFQGKLFNMQASAKDEIIKKSCLSFHYEIDRSYHLTSESCPALCSAIMEVAEKQNYDHLSASNLNAITRHDSLTFEHSKLGFKRIWPLSINPDCNQNDPKVYFVRNESKQSHFEAVQKTSGKNIFLAIDQFLSRIEMINKAVATA